MFITTVNCLNSEAIKILEKLASKLAYLCNKTLFINKKKQASESHINTEKH
jgi:hypothetical protein